LIKNSQLFGKKFQKTVGGFFLTHAVGYVWETVLQVKRPNQQYHSTEGTHRIDYTVNRKIQSTHINIKQQIP